MRSININDKRKKSKPRKFSYLTGIILAILGIFLFFYTTDREKAGQAFSYIFTPNSNEVVYETFDVYLDSIGEDYSTEIVADLSVIQFEEKPRFNFVDGREKADIAIEYGVKENSIFSEYLLPIGHMYWVMDSISTEDLQEGGYEVVMEEQTYSRYRTFLEKQYPEILVSGVEDIEQELFNEDCNCVGLIESENLRKEQKLLKFNDSYHLDSFEGGLEVSLVVNEESEDVDVDFVTNIISKNVELTSTEFSQESIAKVNMTGVTALARRVAKAMDTRNDYEYPARNIADFLSDADLTHTSNEISFVEGCSTYSGLRFCSRPESIATLKAIGVDLVELTGNHNNDFGSNYNTQTINAYKEEGIAYFGGGLNSEDAAKPYVTEIDGTTIGFLGYNYYDAVVAGSTNALAGSNKAGANPYSESRMKSDIESLREEVDIIIVDFQFQECYSYPSGDVIYPVCYKPINNQASTFRKAIQYGADIVVGTQAHQPQTYELYKDGVIFYGLGNLFFDQTPWIGTRQGMVLTHYFKEGELIQTKITPTIYDSSLQVEVANQEDAQLLLELLSTARKSL